MSREHQSLEHAMDCLQTAKALEKEMNALKDEAKEILMNHLTSDNTTYESSQYPGKAVYIPAGVTKRFSKDKASQKLAEKGVAVSVIQDAYQYATSESPRAAYIKYEQPKANS